jgi:YHS domain-containing protein
MKIRLVTAVLVVAAVIVSGSFIIAQWNTYHEDEQASRHSHASGTAHDNSNHSDSKQGESKHGDSTQEVVANGPLAGIKCPISTAQVKERFRYEYRGATLYFCCGHCSKAFERSQEKFTADANAQLVATGQAQQLKCPLTGKKVDPATEISVEGVEVAFCCNDCRKQASDSEGAAQSQMVFNDKAFARGFQVIHAAQRNRKVR